MEIIGWHDGKLRLLDQTRLPGEETYLEITEIADLAAAIRRLCIRGAPALGVAAAYGLALAAATSRAAALESFRADVRGAADALAATRPTAVNLHWALRRVLAIAEAAPNAEAARQAVLAEARRIHQEIIEGRLCSNGYSRSHA